MRKGRIGGSEIGCIMGWSPFKSREDLMADKLGLVERKPTSKAMERGIYLEDAVRRWLCDKEGFELDPERSTGTWVLEEDERISYNADGVTTCDRLIEIKCPEFRDEEHGWGRQGKNSDKVPKHYWAQAQYGMMMFGLEECYFGVLSGQPRFEFARYVVKADPEAQAWMLEEAQKFLDELATLQEGAPEWLNN